MESPGPIKVIPITSRRFHGGELLSCRGHYFLFSPKVISTCFQYSEAQAQMLGRPAHSLRPLSISCYTIPKCFPERESLQRQRSSWGVVAVVFSLRQKVESVYRHLLLPRRKPLSWLRRTWPIAANFSSCSYCVCFLVILWRENN